MTTSIFAAALLAAALAADPAAAPGAAPAAKAMPAAPPAETAAAAHAAHAAATAPADAARALPAGPEALADARAALLGPCKPEMAKGKVTAVEVLDGAQLNARREKEGSKKPKAEPAQRFRSVSYAAGNTKGKSVRQVTSQLMLTTEQAKVLVGEKLCVFKE
jgi:hypothetical protein